MTNRSITYELGYSNFAFELWMVLHKHDCNGRSAIESSILALFVRLLERSSSDRTKSKCTNQCRKI